MSAHLLKRMVIAWEVIVEPDEVRRLLVVITAYPVEIEELAQPMALDCDDD